MIPSDGSPQTGTGKTTVCAKAKGQSRGTEAEGLHDGSGPTRRLDPSVCVCAAASVMSGHIGASFNTVGSGQEPSEGKH